MRPAMRCISQGWQASSAIWIEFDEALDIISNLSEFVRLLTQVFNTTDPDSIGVCLFIMHKYSSTSRAY